MSIPTVEDRLLIVEDVLFGTRPDPEKGKEKRSPGVAERLSWLEHAMKFMVAGLMYLILHASGVPTDQILNWLIKVVSSIGWFQ